MWSWLRETPEVLVGFPARVRNLREDVGSGMIFGITSGLIQVANDGGLAPGVIQRRPPSVRPTTDWTESMKYAEYMGRWLASTDADVVTVLARWGLRP